MILLNWFQPWKYKKIVEHYASFDNKIALMKLEIHMWTRNSIYDAPHW